MGSSFSVPASYKALDAPWKLVGGIHGRESSTLPWLLWSSGWRKGNGRASFSTRGEGLQGLEQAGICSLPAGLHWAHWLGLQGAADAWPCLEKPPWIQAVPELVWQRALEQDGSVRLAPSFEHAVLFDPSCWGTTPGHSQAQAGRGRLHYSLAGQGSSRHMFRDTLVI